MSHTWIINCCNTFHWEMSYFLSNVLGWTMTVRIIWRLTCPFLPFRMFSWSASPLWVQRPTRTSELRWAALTHVCFHDRVLMGVCVFGLHPRPPPLNIKESWVEQDPVCVSEEMISPGAAINIIRKNKILSALHFPPLPLVSFQGHEGKPSLPFHKMEQQIAYAELWDRTFHRGST